MRTLFAVLCTFVTSAFAQQSATIRVDAGKIVGPNTYVWSYFGYDEPNYTTAPNGRKLIRELSDLSANPPAIRVHNLLTTGNGVASLKWGSTNAYTEDANGNPIYNWTIVDGIIDTFLEAGVRPFIEIGFMPKALSTHPAPYQHHFPKEENVFTGWSYPPNNYAKWDELVYRWVEHCAQRYGKARVESWQWEVWNEPDIPYWHGTPDEYDLFYDHTTAAVRRALPNAKVGGPASTGPGNPKAAAFLRQFLDHCVSTGAPLDFISFHAKGSPKISGSEVQMGLARHLKDIQQGFDIVRSFPKFKNLPIVLSESDPEGCAACSAPQNAYRNGTLYAVYMAASQKAALDLAATSGVNLQGFLTWAFEFENQPYFAGLRSLATNGIDQPVLNVFRMLGLMIGDFVSSTSDRAEPVDRILAAGVPQPEIDALATRSDHEISIMVWNYQDPDRTDSLSNVRLSISGLPQSQKRLLLRHYRIDSDHSNSYAVWKQMGSPQQPTNEQIAKLQAAGELQQFESPRYINNDVGLASLDFALPLQGVSLIQLSW